MSPIFDFQTIKTFLKKNTRTLVIKLDRSQEDNAINMQMIQELQTLFNWCAKHIEVYSILFTSSQTYFSCGFNKKEIRQLSNKEIQNQIIKLQNLVYSMFFLPQTIVFDLRAKAQGVALELAIPADIRLARTGCQICFDHLLDGLVPACGGIGFLSELIPRASLKSWILSADQINLDVLISTGLIHDVYFDEVRIEEELQKIFKQSQVARIQTKRSFLESILPQLEKALSFEKQFAFPSLSTEDWKKERIDDTTSTNNFYDPLKLATKLYEEAN